VGDSAASENSHFTLSYKISLFLSIGYPKKSSKIGAKKQYDRFLKPAVFYKIRHTPYGGKK